MLINNLQIEGNLRRTASKGLISLLNKQQLELLAFKYFGIKDEYGNIVGYQCPYSGKIYNDYKDIVLEHIIPVNSNGGTVLFNCIPTSREVNNFNEKGAKHLISWWTNSKYWDKDAPFRLEKIVNYMLDGYEQVFKEYTIEEVESSYLVIETDENILDEEDKDINYRTENKLLKQAKNNGIQSYLGFIYDCIKILDKHNIKTSSIKEKLQQLQNQNIFKDIDKYQLYQNIIQKLVVSRIGDNNSSYLTYTLNFDVKKLMDLTNLDNEQDIYNELNSRLQNIEQLLKENNLSIIEYFKSLKDIQDIDIIYKNNISPEDIKIFLENIKLGIDTKINIFIDMISDENRIYTSYENGTPNKKNIFSSQNKISFKGYENIDGVYVNQFWQGNSDKILETLDKLENKPNNTEKDKEKYQRARKAIREFKFQCQETGLNLRIECFIDMISDENRIYTSYENGIPNKKNIFSKRNKIPFKGYENIEGLNVNQFWIYNSDKIEKMLEKLENKPNNTEKDKEKYQRAKKAIREFKFQCQETGLNLRIECFIDMISDENRIYTSYENGEVNRNNIFSQHNKIPFKGYENIEGLNTNTFWQSNSDKILETLDKLENEPDNTEKDKEKYQRARKAIKEYEFQSKTSTSGLILRIECFIDMISDENRIYTSYENGEPNQSNIFKHEQQPPIPFKGYESIEGLSTNHFWNRNSDKILEILDKLENKPNNTEKDIEKYQRARKAIKEYEFQSKTSTSGLMLRTDCFIKMLTDKQYTSDGNNIFKRKQQPPIPFKGYESIDGLNTARFWESNSQKIIIPLLFYNKQYDGANKVYIDSEKDYSTKEYDNARIAVLEHLGVKDIHEYIDKLEQKEKKSNQILELISLRNGLKKTLELLKTQESKLIDENNELHNEYIEKHKNIETRRAM